MYILYHEIDWICIDTRDCLRINKFLCLICYEIKNAELILNSLLLLYLHVKAAPESQRERLRKCFFTTFYGFMLRFGTANKTVHFASEEAHVVYTFSRREFALRVWNQHNTFNNMYLYIENDLYV